MTRSKWIVFGGLAGLVLFIFGVIGALVTGSFSQPLMAIHLVLGLVLMSVWLVSAGFGSLATAGQLVRGRGARFGANLVVYVLVVAGLVLVANWFASRYNRRWDWTSEGVFSLSSQSVQVVKDLKAPLKIVGLTPNEVMPEDQFKDLLELYRYNNSGKVTVELIDPRSKPHLVDKYEMKPGNLVYIEYGEGEQKGQSRLNQVSEQEITNAVIKLARGAARKLYYVTGHEEPDMGEEGSNGLKALGDALGDENLRIEPIVLAQKADVPEDAAALILVSPKQDLLPAERESVIRYVENGGRLLLMSDPQAPRDAKAIAAHFGIEIGNNLVIDQVQRLFAGPALGAQPVVTTYASHPVTREMNRSTITIFNVASTVSASPTNKIQGAQYTELLKTGQTAWGESDLAGVFESTEPTAVFDQATDKQGPLSLAVAFENKSSGKDGDSTSGSDVKFEKVSRVIVFGDSDWVLNPNLEVYANRDLVLNCVNWLVGEEGGITVRPGKFKASAMPVQAGVYLLLLTSSFLVPEIFLLFGLYVWWKRRGL